MSTDGTRPVAGRDAYELVLAPKDTRSLVGQVRLAVDAETSVPLRVQVFGRASADGPAFSVGFTKISFEVPGDDAVPVHAAAGGDGAPRARCRSGADRPPVRRPSVARAGGAVRTVGSGWTTVVVVRGVAPSAEGSGRAGRDRS